MRKGGRKKEVKNGVKKILVFEHNYEMKRFSRGSLDSSV